MRKACMGEKPEENRLRTLSAFVSALLVLGLILAGCTPTSGPGVPLTKVASTAAAATGQASVVQGQDCGDPIGCILLNPGVPIHIAYLLALTGGNSAIGTNSRTGVQLAIEDAGGKILGHTVQFDGQDDGCNAKQGLDGATWLADDPTIVAVIGPSCSSAAVAGVPQLSKAGLLVVSPSSTLPDLTDPASPNHFAGFFRTVYNAQAQGTAAADYAYNILNIRSAATIQEGTSTQLHQVQAFADEFRTLGGTISLQTSVTAGQLDMSTVLPSLSSASPGLIYFPIPLPEAGALLEQAGSTAGLENTRWMAADGLYARDVASIPGAGVDRLTITIPLVQGQAFEAFVAKFAARFGSQPINILNYDAYAYDAFNILKAAIEKAAEQQANGGILLPRQGLRDTLAGMSAFSGVSGSLTCHPSGDCADPVIGVYQYQAGKYPPSLVWSSKP